MNFITFIMTNVIHLIKSIFSFIDKSSILSNLLVAIIIGLFLVYIFRVPNFELKSYSKLNVNKNGSLFFDFKNRKSLMSYDSDEVFYKIYLPLKLVSKSDQIEISTIDGWASWNPLHNLDDKDHLRIGNLDYIVINGVSRLNVFPNQSVTLFRINGNFKDREGGYKIFYQFRTRYGFYPVFISTGWKDLFIKKFEGKQEDILKGILPFALLQI